jgi:N-methylhydantoinase B
MIDPISLSVIWNGLVAVSEEIGVTLRRSAYSEGVREGRDFSAALFDVHGRMISQGDFSPGHLGSMPFAVRHVLGHYPLESFEPGDAVLVNDLYMGSGHLPDFFLTTPIFHRGTLRGFAVNCAHMVDVGGTGPGSQAVDVADFYQEGLRLLPTKVYRRGEPIAELLRIIEANVRVPEKVLGDLKAQRNASRIGELRMQELLDQHGAEAVLACIEQIFDHSEAEMRRALRRIPAGTYVAEDYFDDYGEGTEPLKIRVAVTIRDGGVTFDFAGSSPQTHSGLNSLLNYTRAYCLFTIKSVTLRNDIPQNEGCLRPIAIVAPEGSLFNPRPPAAGGARPIMQQRIVDTLLLALAQAVPDQVIANSCHWANPIYGGWDPRHQRPFVYYEMIIGGIGARPHKDGADGLCSSFNLENIPVEVNETNYPLIVERIEFVPDTGGPGRFRGGTALRKDVRVLGENVSFSNLAERQRFDPVGLFGGRGGGRGRTVLNPGAPGERVLHSKGIYRLSPGDVVSGMTSGSGGYGPPWDRDPQAVRADVRDGFVTRDGARRDYGVDLDPETLDIGEEETRALRARMAADGPGEAPDQAR